MEPLIAITVVLLLILVVLASKLQSQRRPKGEVHTESDGNEQPDKANYTRIGPMFSPAERSFLGVLDQAVGDDFRVFGKVRIADVVAVNPQLDGGDRQSAQNRINAKHVDFVPCSKDDLSVAAAIELNDRSHQKNKTKARDEVVADICRSIGLPLLQIPAHRQYSVNELRSRLLQEVGHQEELSKPEETVSPSSLDQPVTEEHEEHLWEALESDSDDAQQADSAVKDRPLCPKCSAPMVRRVARSGKHAGQEFWGCPSYPKCRGVLGLDAMSS